MTSTVRRWLFTLIADTVCVLAFAAGGKSSHEASDSNWVVLEIAWPFLLAALVAHVGLPVASRVPLRVWPDGAIVVATTYAGGMLIRVATGRGIAAGFLIVAVIFLTVTMLGWRALVAALERRSAARRGGSVSAKPDRA